MKSDEVTPEDFFRSVPTEVTDVPIFVDENDRWYAYGHLDPAVMIDAIKKVDSYYQEEPLNYKIEPTEIQYHYAKVSEPVDSSLDEWVWEEELTFITCKPTEEGAFPISTWNS